MRLVSKFTVVLLINLAWSQLATASQVSGVRFWQDPEKTRLVFDVSDAVDYQLFTLKNPHRLVVDIKNAELLAKLSEIEAPDQLVSQIRASKKTDKLRLVLDLKKSVSTKHFLLKPFQNYGHRLVVDLRDKDAKKTVVKTVTSAQSKEKRDIVIAIDAGHGGEDPGASGTNKTREKAITLAVAKRLSKAINREKGMKAVLTRSGDYYVSLRKRTDIARKNKADLFISLHADAFTDKRVKGASVWVLSPKGASSEMGRWLEQREKSSDLAGGVEIANKDPLVAQVLLDLSMHYSVGASINAAKAVYQAMRSTLPKMHKKSVQKASFVVLKMPDIPAMLVEMAFISNPTEEKQLKTSKQQEKISRAVLSGIKSFFNANPPDGTLYASLAKSRSHKVKSGDTLSAIAQSYGVSTNRLKSHNNLKSSMLRVGQTILIPGV